MYLYGKLPIRQNTMYSINGKTLGSILRKDEYFSRGVVQKYKCHIDIVTRNSHRYYDDTTT